MPLQAGDLKDTVLKKISLDEFEPKTGDEKDVAVVGFYVNTESAAQDMYNFLNGSIVEIRDVEQSPNPNDEGYYMVFLEMDRVDDLVENVQAVISELENVAGKLNWQIKTPYMEDYLPLDEADKYIQTSKDDYLTASEYKDKLEAELEKANLESMQSESIMEFLENTNLLKVEYENKVLKLADARNSINLEVIDFGEGSTVMEQLGINESAINLNPDQFLFKGLKSMLGELKALPIDEFVVIYNPSHKDILVTKPC